MATTGAGSPAADGAEPRPPEVASLSYASASAELDAIIEEFETGVVDVDRLVDQLERATDIVDELDRRLRRTRMRVEELVPRLEAIGNDDASDDDRPVPADPRRSDGDDAVGPGGTGDSPGLF
jgi:exodeoxyribonuclease VII small subunit